MSWLAARDPTFYALRFQDEVLDEATLDYLLSLVFAFDLKYLPSLTQFLRTGLSGGDGTYSYASGGVGWCRIPRYLRFKSTVRDRQARQAIVLST